MNEQQKAEVNLQLMKMVTDVSDDLQFSSQGKLSDAQLINEINYWRSVRILKKLLHEGFISEDELIKIDALNRGSFSPALAQLMPSIP